MLKYQSKAQQISPRMPNLLFNLVDGTNRRVIHCDKRKVYEMFAAETQDLTRSLLDEFVSLLSEFSQ